MKQTKAGLWKSIAQVIFFIILILAVGLFVFVRLSSSVTSNIDTYVYNLPYKAGATYGVAQGYGGLFSHKNIAALDFDMPSGSPVYAAREGAIYAFKDDSDEGGPFAKYAKKANYIIIRHDDGSYGCYWHLQKEGVAVKNGRVSKGQLIGYSGATGFVLRPHLHFSVKRKLNYNKDSFVQTKFNTSEGVQLLVRGGLYQRPVP